MQRRTLHALTFLLLGACGSASPPATDACVHVDGRGAGTPDGSAAHPFATLDAALAALGTAGGAVCLSAGEHRPPSRPITVPLTLTGSSAADSTFSPSAGGACLAADGLYLANETLGAGTAVLEARADLVLRDVGLAGCIVGVHVVSGTTVIERVAIAQVQTGIDVAAGGALATSDTTIRLQNQVGAQTVPGGIVSFGGSSNMVGAGTDISGVGIAAGVYLHDADATIETAMLHGLTFGVVALSNTDARMVELHGATLDTLTSQLAPLDPTRHIGGYNFVAGGHALLDHVTVSAAEAGAFVANGATTVIDGGSFSGMHQLVRIQGGTAELRGAITLSGGELGLASVQNALDASAPSAVVRVTGTLTSTGGAFAHVMADTGGSLTLEGAGSTFTGGSLGLTAWGGSHLVVSAGATVSDTDVAVVSFDTGTRTEVTRLVATPRTHAVMTSAATTQVTDSMLSGGLHPILIIDGSLAVSGGMIQGGLSSGVRVLGGDAMLDGVTIDHAGGAGVSIESGTLGLTGVHVTASGDVGVAAHGTPTLSVASSTFDGNLGAAIALYGGTLTVTGSTFLPSVPAAGGRSDEIRITAETAAAPASLDVSGSSFQLDTVTCAPDTCTMILSSGVGAQAIVRPNCIVVPDANVMKGLAQDGGTITDMTVGMTLGVRVVPGQLVSPGAFPMLPMIGALPMPPGGMGVTRGL